ncbi:ABC transporter ATP-binding protein [Clostridium chrysemydis]|uniref:ABC transporter ATP-binding protein n=1 Tax=Clostridium chrysemydis TaxID=2665504 RepID=UPI003F2D4C13
MECIRLEEITKKYGKDKNTVTVLDKFNYTFEKGKFYMIRGASGSGKTTILNIINGLDEEYTGTCYINNENVTNKNEKGKAKIRALDMGYIHQEYLLLEDLSVLENVKIRLKCKNKYLKEKITSKSIKEKSIKVLESLGLKDHINKSPKELSGGQKQRVAIGRCLVSDVEIILADEPTGALDSKITIEIMDLLKGLNKEGKTIIMVTHDISILDYADEIINLI